MKVKEEFNDINKLCEYVEYFPSSFIIVCGYDNVGKGRLLTELRRHYKLYYPDYDLICKATSQKDRWTYFMYFLDIYSKLNWSLSIRDSVVFDRSAICGAVYNKDESIAIMYEGYMKDIDHIHVLVKCTKEDYEKLQEVRDSEVKFTYEEYLIHTELYEYYFETYELDYVVFNNEYDYNYGEFSKHTCLGCSFNKYGNCTNKFSGRDKISDTEIRCDRYRDKEVQDIDE